MHKSVLLQHVKELISLQSSVADQMEKLQQLRDLLTIIQDGAVESTNPYSDLKTQLDSLKLVGTAVTSCLQCYCYFVYTVMLREAVGG